MVNISVGRTADGVHIVSESYALLRDGLRCAGHTLGGGTHAEGPSPRRRATAIAGNSLCQLAGAVALGLIGDGRRAMSYVMRSAALALALLLSACSAPGSVASSPYHAPNDSDIGHAGGGGGGGGGAAGAM